MLNLANIIDQVGKDKGIDKHILIEALESAMLKAAEKRFGPNKVIEAHYQEEMGEIELFLFKEVVEEVTDPDTQISFEDARELDPEAALGDSLGVKLDSKEFGRIDAQTAKQIIIQKVREAERNIVYNEYSSKRGEIVTGIVQRFEKGDIIVDLGRAEALLSKKEQVRREGYRQGERIRGVILEVKVEARGPQITLSRTHPAFIIKLFQMEVPEVYEGIVEIKGAAREPGDRAKIAVVSHNSDVDPVGACVGVKGSRVQAVVQELKGEKIDIVHWSDDPAIYVKNTLSPAQISRVIVDDEEHAMEVIVPDDQLSLAIGKKGQNVRLAAKLTGWKIDIRTESESKGIKEKLSPEEALRKEVQAAGEREDRERAAAASDIGETLGLSPELATKLAAAGYVSADSLTHVTREELEKIEGLDEEDIEAVLGAVSERSEKGNA
ncbi:MAG: transcription termination/antitermination protein NusA [Deltaproteobacteria bacterium]|nr:transcription termination/antitermination protein NusA [Deltaproteobacteria bacterium]MBZ0218819.1 transcription termination factor NusA [Deltaproteobacteria bacterium]